MILIDRGLRFINTRSNIGSFYTDIEINPGINLRAKSNTSANCM